MYDFCSTVTGLLSLGIIILGVIGYRRSLAEKSAPKDLAQPAKKPEEQNGGDGADPLEAGNSGNTEGIGDGEAFEDAGNTEGTENTADAGSTGDDANK